MPGVFGWGGLHFADHCHGTGLLSGQGKGFYSLHLAAQHRDGLFGSFHFCRAVRTLKGSKHSPYLDKGQAIFCQHPKICHRTGSGKIKLFPQLAPGCFLCPSMQGSVLLSQPTAQLLQKDDALIDRYSFYGTE